MAYTVSKRRGGSKLGKKISDFLKSEIILAVFYMVFGLCLILIPEQTIHIICKIIFGVVMIGVGIYHIWIYAGEKEKSTILDLFTGVIVLVLGGFLFFTPQIIVKILPYLLGAFVLVDNIWMLKGSWKLKKIGDSNWKVLLIGSACFAALGIIIMVYPFAKITDTVFLAGCVLMADGLGDMVFLYLLKSGMKKGNSLSENGSDGTLKGDIESKEKKKFKDLFDRAKKEDVTVDSETDEGENEEELENEVIINGRWKSAPEEVSETEQDSETEEVLPKDEEVAVGKSEEEQEEVLEEWKD